MQDLELLLEINERLKRIERKQKTKTAFKTVFVILLIAVIAFGVYKAAPVYKSAVDMVEKIQQVKPQLDGIIDTIGALDANVLESAAEKLNSVDFEGISSVVEKIKGIDIDSINSMVQKVDSFFNSLGSFGSIF